MHQSGENNRKFINSKYCLYFRVSITTGNASGTRKIYKFILPGSQS